MSYVSYVLLFVSLPPSPRHKKRSGTAKTCSSDEQPDVPPGTALAALRRHVLHRSNLLKKVGDAGDAQGAVSKGEEFWGFEFEAVSVLSFCGAIDLFLLTQEFFSFLSASEEISYSALSCHFDA